MRNTCLTAAHTLVGMRIPTLSSKAVPWREWNLHQLHTNPQYDRITIRSVDRNQGQGQRQGRLQIWRGGWGEFTPLEGTSPGILHMTRTPCIAPRKRSVTRSSRVLMLSKYPPTLSMRSSIDSEGPTKWPVTQSDTDTHTYTYTYTHILYTTFMHPCYLHRSPTLSQPSYISLYPAYIFLVCLAYFCFLLVFAHTELTGRTNRSGNDRRTLHLYAHILHTALSHSHSPHIFHFTPLIYASHASPIYLFWGRDGGYGH